MAATTLHGEVDLAALGALLADRTRATILLTLLGGGLTSASALAARADVSPSLASNHLRRLTDGGLIVAERRGRQRLYRLAGTSVADALERLVAIAPAGEERSLRGVRERDGLRGARLCYDHLAGRAATVIADALVRREWLADETQHFALTPSGAAGFAEIGIAVGSLTAAPRPLTRACADWSEGCAHLAGGVGAALTAELLRRGWLQGREASRVVSLTAEGYAGLGAWLGVDRAAFTPLEPTAAEAA